MYYFPTCSMLLPLNVLEVYYYLLLLASRPVLVYSYEARTKRQDTDHALQSPVKWYVQATKTRAPAAEFGHIYMLESTACMPELQFWNILGLVMARTRKAWRLFFKHFTSSLTFLIIK